MNGLMFAIRAFLGGILIAAVATVSIAPSAMAQELRGPQTDIRPISRFDAAIQRAEVAIARAEEARLAAAVPWPRCSRKQDRFTCCATL